MGGNVGEIDLSACFFKFITYGFHCWKIIMNRYIILGVNIKSSIFLENIYIGLFIAPK